MTEAIMPFYATPEATKAVALYKDGRSLADLAQLFGVGHTTIRRALIKHGTTLRPTRRPSSSRQLEIAERRAKIMRLAAHGLLQSQIAEMLGVSYRVVYKDENVLNIPGRKGIAFQLWQNRMRAEMRNETRLVEPVTVVPSGHTARCSSLNCASSPPGDGAVFSEALCQD